jgi:polyisoprenoid-binding protein YceI
MADDLERHLLGPSAGRLILRTSRDGLGARAGHDLMIEMTRWTGELTVDGGRPAGLEVRVDLHSFTVREGTGGVKPLTDRDRREIAATARRLLAADRYPEATFRASGAEQHDATWVINGTLTLGGTTRPVQLEATPVGTGRYRVTGSVTQSEFGIKPYTAFLGALRVRDEVGVEAEAGLGGQPGEAAQP